MICASSAVELCEPQTRRDEQPAILLDEFNLAATFLPKTSPSEVPCISVAGVQVAVYVDRMGVVRVSVDLDTADEAIVTAHQTVPLLITTVQGQTVYVGT